MMNALGSSGLMLTVSSDEEAAAARKFKSEGVAYRRYAQGNETVFLHGSPALGGEEVALYALDWKGLTQPPPGKNISGKLGAEKKVASSDEREMMKVKLESVVIEHPDPNHSEDQMAADIRDAQELSILKTAYLNPDSETLQKCLDTRMADFKLHLEDRGYNVKLSVCKNTPVPVDEIDWTENNSRIRKIRRSAEGMVFKTLEQARIWKETWEGRRQLDQN